MRVLVVRVTRFEGEATMSKELDPKEQVRSAWARIGTLPKWAQDEMQRLHLENKEIRAFHESLTQPASPEARANRGIWVPSKPILNWPASMPRLKRPMSSN